MTQRFKNKTALITGGSRGIGKGIANRFAEEGARIAIIDIDQEALNSVKKEMEALNYEVFTKVVNVVDPYEVDTVVEEIIEVFESIDILVNNAGILRDNLLFRMSNDDWQKVLDVHLNGAFNVSRSVQKYMVKSGYGRIINISSTSALGNRGQANYATAKAGLQGLTKTLAIELGQFGITSNAIAPGFIETDMTKETAKRVGVPFDEFIKKAERKIPVRRTGKSTDIANVAAFFADDRSSFVNGQIIYVAGGPKN